MLKKSSALLCFSVLALFGSMASAGAQSSASVLQIEEGTTGAGFCGVDGWIHNNHPGFTADGFANTQNTLGNGVDYAIYVDTAGTYDFEFGYALGGAARPAEIQVAGVTQPLVFDGTGGWRNYAVSDVQRIELPAGIHTLRLEGTGKEALPNLDWMTISGASVDVAPCNGDFTPTMLQLFSPTSVDWVAGSTGWLNLTMTSDVSVRNVSVTVIDASEGVSFSYPSNGDHSAPSQDSTVSPSEIDYSSINFTTPSAAGAATATIQIDFEWLGAQYSVVETLEFSNVDYEGDDFAILTEAAELTTSSDAPEQNWLELSYLGLSPVNSDLEVSVSGDLEAYHPQGAFTGLHADDHLHVGERDVARVWFDPTTLNSGSHTMTVSIDYIDVNGVAKNVSHDVTVVVN